ncbi:MAG: glycosyltransferase family 2 protein [Bacteroidia bacterium]
MTEPLISIVVCTYNGELYLTEQLDSVVNQTYPNIEIIILDDCSTDGTVEIISKYVNRYPTVKFYRNENNIGYVKNFEKGITLSQGQFIALCDQDDIWDFDKLKLLSTQVKEAALIYHDSELIGTDGVSLNQKISDRINMYQGHKIYPFLLYNCVSGHSMMFRTSLIQKILPIDPSYFHDWQIAIIAAENGGIRYLDMALVKYRQHHLSNTDFMNLRKKEGYQKTQRKKLVNFRWLKFLSTRLNASLFLEECVSGLESDFKTRLKLSLTFIKEYKLIFFIKKKPAILKIIKAMRLPFY